jgi:hypothetical protein
MQIDLVISFHLLSISATENPTPASRVNPTPASWLNPGAGKPGESDASKLAESRRRQAG